MSRTNYTDDAPWLGENPMSSAVKVGDFVFLAGQTALNPDGSIGYPGDLTGQTKVAFERLISSLEQAGGTVDDLVDLLLFTSDPRALLPAMNVGAEFLPAGSEPAVTAVGSTGAVSPEALVTLRGIAVLGDEPKQCITPDPSWWTSMPASAACRKGDMVFVSGQVSVDSDGAIIAPGSHAGQAREALDEVSRLLREAGGSLDDLLDMLSFHRDARGMDEVADPMEATYPNATPATSPAWTAIGATALYSADMMGIYRAIADLSPGERTAKIADSVWWKDMKIAGVSKKEGGTFVGIAGQVSSDGDGEIMHSGDVAAQAEYCLQQLDDCLQLHGGSVADIVEVTAYHKDPRDWETVTEVAAGVFGDNRPAWTSVGCTGLYQEGYLHEIHALAVIE